MDRTAAEISNAKIRELICIISLSINSYDNVIIMMRM